MKISIAKRIKRSMIGLAVTLCLIFTFMAMMMVYVTEDQVFMNLLRSEQQQFESLAVAEQTHWQPVNQKMTLYQGIDQLPADLRSIVGDKPGVYEHFDDARAMFVLRSQSTSGAIDYFISYDVSDLLAVRTSRNDLLLTVLVVSLMLIFVAVLVAYRLASQTLAPLKKLTAQLQDKHQDLPNNFADDFYGDEVGLLAKQLEISIDQAQSAAQREFEFNRGVSHELRSPIQIAQNALELLDLNKNNPDFNPRAVIDRLCRSVEQMKQVTEAFLWLASDLEHSDQNCDMKRCAESLIVEFRATHPDHMIHLNAAVDDGLTINVPADVFTVVVGNLIQNAIQHGCQKQVSCVLNSDSIVIKNPRDKEATHNGSGYGVGTIIAQRMCERLGWQVNFDQRDQDVYVVEVVFDVKA